MSLIEQLYESLAHGPTPDCDEILTAGLKSAEPEYFDRIAEILLQRGHLAAWAGLIEHFDQLSLDTRRQLQANEERRVAAIALSFKAAHPDARYNALLAFTEQPNPKLAYLLPPALRDPAGKVRDAAAHVFRATADVVAGRDERCASETDAAALDEYAADRAQFVLAAREVVRTFDRHHRVELLEASLWFASDLGDVLWDQLDNARSRAGRVVIEHLETWNNPRIAGFLLWALARQEWRSPAAHALRAWKSPTYFLALLRNSAIGHDPQVRNALATIRRPEWFVGIDAQMSKVPQPLRRHVPWWVCYLGLTPDDKITLLSQWTQSTQADVQRAAVYALATLGTASAVTRLRRIASDETPVATFARWYLSGYAAPPARTGTVEAPAALTAGVGT